MKTLSCPLKSPPMPVRVTRIRRLCACPPLIGVNPGPPAVLALVAAGPWLKSCFGYTSPCFPRERWLPAGPAQALIQAGPPAGVRPGQTFEIMNLTRNGKIARLPKVIREELNQRLDNGEQGGPLLKWLNSLPKVLALMTAEFGGKPVNKQSLSEWRRGGNGTGKYARFSALNPGRP
jgi:hypothetical protein